MVVALVGEQLSRVRMTHIVLLRSASVVDDDCVVVMSIPRLVVCRFPYHRAARWDNGNHEMMMTTTKKKKKRLDGFG